MESVNLRLLSYNNLRESDPDLGSSSLGWGPAGAPAGVRGGPGHDPGASGSIIVMWLDIKMVE